MELNLVLLLSAIIQTTTMIDRVQGFINSTSSSLSGVGSYKPIYNNELIEKSRHRHLRQFEQSFKHYSASENRREPRFISFQTKDDNIEVEIDFAIPFLSIPVKRSLSGAMGTLQNVINGIPMANINVGAVLLTGIVVVGGAMIGGISRLFNGGSFVEVTQGWPFLKASRNKQQKQDTMGDQEGNEWWNILEEIDKALLKYDLDTTSCAQRAICWYIKESKTNIEENRGSSFDHLISGLSSSDYIHRLLSNTAWNTALNAGRRGVNCESTFSTCSLSPEHLETFSNKIKKFARQK